MNLSVDKEELKRIVPVNNQTILEMPRKLGRVSSEDNALRVDPRFSWGEHVPTELKVVGISDGSFLQKGDIALCRYLAVWNALHPGQDAENPGEGKMITVGDSIYVFVSEESIYGYVRDGELYGANGMVLVEYVQQEDERLHAGIAMSGDTKKRYSRSFGRARVISRGDKFQVGDRVVFEGRIAVPLNRITYKAFNGGVIHRIHESDVVGVE